jgi:hypothetical protein
VSISAADSRRSSTALQFGALLERRLVWNNIFSLRIVSWEELTTGMVRQVQRHVWNMFMLLVTCGELNRMGWDRDFTWASGATGYLIDSLYIDFAWCLCSKSLRMILINDADYGVALFCWVSLESCLLLWFSTDAQFYFQG